MRAAGVDLRVAYYASVPADRRAMGWSDKPDLPEGESFVEAKLSALDAIPDWRERIPTDYADLVNRYYKALSEKGR